LALLVFLCDQFATLKPAGLSPKEKNAIRFFRMGSKLPLPLQMLLARRSCLSPKLFFLSSQMDAALYDTFASFEQ